MQIKRERLNECMSEVEPLLLDYFARTEAQQGQPKLDMDWLAFYKIEAEGKLVILTARKGDELIGFAIYVLFPHLHHSRSLWAMCDILAVNPDHRNQGVATEIVKHAEKRFRVMGVDQLVHGFRTIYDTTPLFEKLGFECIERWYRKAL